MLHVQVTFLTDQQLKMAQICELNRFVSGLSFSTGVEDERHLENKLDEGLRLHLGQCVPPL